MISGEEDDNLPHSPTKFKKLINSSDDEFGPPEPHEHGGHWTADGDETVELVKLHGQVSLSDDPEHHEGTEGNLPFRNRQHFYEEINPHPLSNNALDCDLLLEPIRLCDNTLLHMPSECSVARSVSDAQKTPVQRDTHNNSMNCEVMSGGYMMTMAGNTVSVSTDAIHGQDTARAKMWTSLVQTPSHCDCGSVKRHTIQMVSANCESDMCLSVPQVRLKPSLRRTTTPINRTISHLSESDRTALDRGSFLRIVPSVVVSTSAPRSDTVSIRGGYESTATTVSSAAHFQSAQLSITCWWHRYQ